MTISTKDAGLMMKRRLETLALTADVASHWIDDMRAMPAKGVARAAWDAIDHIDDLEQQLATARDEAIVMAQKLDAAEIKLRNQVSGARG